jgi:hypothetical protein
MLRGLIHRILGHPEGFKGDVVIFENGQGRPAAFDSIHSDSDMAEYKPFPELDGKVMVNAEQQDVTTIDYLVKTVFSGKPVSAFLMDPFRNVWIAPDDHATNGYHRVGAKGTACVSYPCFTTARGNRIELKEGRWTGSGYAQNMKLIHCAVLKDHDGDIGMTGALKIVYGTVSMSDGTSARRHYEDLGSRCAIALSAALLARLEPHREGLVEVQTVPPCRQSPQQGSSGSGRRRSTQDHYPRQCRRLVPAPRIWDIETLVLL